MDALPLLEGTGLDFASEIDGAMHACGHDTHVAMLLGAARLLVERRDELAGNVLLMFQPGEEGYHGARFMLDEGLLDGADVARAVALHITTRYPAGTVALRGGAMLAVGRPDRRHGPRARRPRLDAASRARPHHSRRGADPRAPDRGHASRRRVRPRRPHDHAGRRGGTTNNIIPDAVELEGTIRTVSPERRAAMAALVHQVADGIAAAHGATIELEIVPGYPVTMNDPEVVAWIRGLAADLAGEAALNDLDDPVMGAEDFSYVIERVPGMMAFLGARPAAEDPETAPQNHSNLVVFEEESMALGVALYAAAALDFLRS